MNKATSDASILSVALDRKLAEPLHSQLARHLRQLILERRVRPGEKLPASRVLAEELSVSRVTTTAAMDQLISEGYAEGRRGAGVFVAADLPDYAPDVAATPVAHGTLPAPEAVKPFESVMPDLRNFPHRIWARLFDQVWRSPEPALMAKADPLGWAPLRAAIAGHLSDWRGVSCDPAQIVVTSGLAEAIALIAQTVLKRGDVVLVEDPGHHILRRSLASNGLTWRPSDVDEHGFDIQRALHESPSARAAAVTPSRQFPLGVTMPLGRRLELLEWSADNGTFVIEDDYDSEYRYQGQPLPALMSLDDRGRVIYVGSFSKVMFPALRLGFVVMPVPLMTLASAAMSDLGPRASLIAQPVLARFMQDGTFATHIRRMRRLYLRRQRALVSAIETHAADLLEVQPSPAGMHAIARFRPELARRMSDEEGAKRATAGGVTTRALSSHYAGRPVQQGLVLGYAGFDEAEIEDGVQRLASALL